MKTKKSGKLIVMCVLILMEMYIIFIILAYIMTRLNGLPSIRLICYDNKYNSINFKVMGILRAVPIL